MFVVFSFFIPAPSINTSLVLYMHTSFWYSLNTQEEKTEDEENGDDEEGEESDSREEDPEVCCESACASRKTEQQQVANPANSHSNSHPPIQQNQEQAKAQTIEEAKHETNLPVDSLVSEKPASAKKAAETCQPTPVAEKKQEAVDAKTPATVEAESSAKRIFVCMAYMHLYLL